MYLMRMIYCSRVSDQFNPEDIDQILEVARKNNKVSNVTGALCFNRKYFLQCLEGGRSAINQVYRQILKDPRHTDIVLLGYDEIIAREFSSWQMAFVPEKHVTDEMNIKYSGTPDFDPFSMSGDSAFELLLELIESVPTV